jgi:hypothetical protein
MHVAAWPINVSKGVSNGDCLICSPQKCAQTWHMYQNAQTDSCSVRHSVLLIQLCPYLALVHTSSKCTLSLAQLVQRHLSATDMCTVLLLGLNCFKVSVCLVLMLEKILSMPAEMPLQCAVVS